MKKILIIEDNKDVRESTADLLELSGYKTETASDGKVGVEKTLQFQPDVILCDIMMPEMDGYDVLETLSKSQKTAGIPFIFLTAKSEKSDFRKGMNLGADDYLTKPFKEHELLDAIVARLRKNEFLKKEFSSDITGINEFLQGAATFLDFENISKEYRSQKYDHKDFVYMEGDGANTLYFVESGSVKTYKASESGKEFVTGIYNAGDFVGQLSLMNPKGTYLESAAVLTGATIYEIPKSDFTHLLYGNREVARKFMKIISNNLIDVQEQMVSIAYATVRQRVAKALLNLYDKGVIKDNDLDGIDISRDEFAGMIGSATETAIRTLSDFKVEGLITVGHARRIVLLDKNRLQRVADFG